jgi:alpha-D-ribose 1-methylphosphonate 5-triphosphate synthase subunit PhnL
VPASTEDTAARAVITALQIGMKASEMSPGTFSGGPGDRGAYAQRVSAGIRQGTSKG